MSKARVPEEILEARGLSRRDVLHKAAVGSIMLAAGGLLAGCGGDGGGGNSNDGVSDADVLNFALNLEYLEAEFYTFATTGAGISAAGIGTDGVGAVGATTGGSQVTFTDARLEDIAQEIAEDERDHVTFLRSALGGARVAKPAINLNALGIGFANENEFLVLARAFEDVGVSAYAGAARLISNKDFLEAAAQILAAEALHTGNIRLQVAIKGLNTSSLDSKDILPPPSGTRYFSIDNNGLAILRSTREVLDIVYAGTGSSGGFFPNGFNGTIQS